MSNNNSVYGDQFMSVEGRFHFVNFAEPDTKGKYPTNKFGCIFLISKESMKTPEFEAMTAALCDVGGVEDIDDLTKHPFLDKNGKFRDGDEEPHVNRAGYPGHIFMKVNTKNRPNCFSKVDSAEPVEIDPAVIKNGDYGLVTLTPHRYDKGCVTLYLNDVCLTKVGERLGGDTSGSSDSKSLFAASFTSGGSGKKSNGSLSGVLD